MLRKLYWAWPKQLKEGRILALFAGRCGERNMVRVRVEVVKAKCRAKQSNPNN